MLFKTTQEIKKHISVNHNFELEDVEPSIRQAARKYIIPAIGAPFFYSLVSAHNPGTTETPEPIKEAIERAQEALANYTYFLFAPIASVQIGNNGIQETSSQGSTPARQWVTYDLKASLLEAGDNALDDLIQYLEENIEAFPAWSESTACSIARELFINNADELGQYVNIQNSRRTFLALKPYVARAERFFVRGLLGDSYFFALKAQITAKNISEENKKVLSFIRPALAPLALLSALPEIALKATADGVKIQSFGNGVIKQDPAAPERISALSRSLEEAGNAELKALESYLLKNGEKIPVYSESDNYKNRITTDTPINPKNKIINI